MILSGDGTEIQVITCYQMIKDESILFFKYNIHGIDNVIMELYLEIVGPFFGVNPIFSFLKA